MAGLQRSREERTDDGEAGKRRDCCGRCAAMSDSVRTSWIQTRLAADQHKGRPTPHARRDIGIAADPLNSRPRQPTLQTGRGHPLDETWRKILSADSTPSLSSEHIRLCSFYL